MLAVQRPTMGSSQPPDGNLPFGYSIDPNDEDIFSGPPPEPAPGAPLLSDNDSRFLVNFFDDMTAGSYNIPSFGEGLNFNDAWLQLPPQLMGTATSLGQSQNTASVPGFFGSPLASPGGDMPHTDYNDMMHMNPGMMPPPPPTRPAPAPPMHAQHQQQQHFHQQQPHFDHQSQLHQQQQQHQQHSADVLAAASLLQQGPSSRPHSAASGSMYAPRRDPVSSLGPPVGHLRHQPLEEFKQAERMNSFGDPTMAGEQHAANMFTDLVFGDSRPHRSHNLASPAHGRSTQPPIQVQYGSDSRFSTSQSYVPDSTRDTYDSIAENQMQYMQCLEPSQSANTTQPSSPSADSASRAYTSRQPLETEAPARFPDDAEVPPRKRRKSRNVKDEDQNGDDSNSKVPVKAFRKGKTPAMPSSQAADNGTSASKRRKSGTASSSAPAAAATAAAAKIPRENLTEAQKRENHIRSEQKRRTIIKEGFDGLSELIPALGEGGLSKSAMLTTTGDWLDRLLKSNAQLTAQLQLLEGT